MSLPQQEIDSILEKIQSGDTSTVPSEINKETYNAVFHDNTHFSHYTRERFIERAKASLFILGDNGYQLDQYGEKAPAAHYEFARDMCRRMHTPLKMSTEGVVGEVTMTGDTVHVVDSRGEMYQCESSIHPTHSKEAYIMRRSETREQTADDFGKDRAETARNTYEDIRMDIMGEHNMDNKDDDDWWPDPDNNAYEKWFYSKGTGEFPEPSEELVGLSNAYYGQPYARPQFLRMSSGRQTFAIDHSGLIWRWDHQYEKYTGYLRVSNKQNPLQGVPVFLTEKGKIIDGITKVAAGQDFFTCIANGKLLVEELPDQEDNIPLPRDSNGVRAGYPCFNETFCYEELKTVSSGEPIPDNYVVVGSVVAYLGADGLLKTVALNEKGKEFGTRLQRANQFGPFRILAGAESRIGLVAQDGNIVLAGSTFGVVKDLHELEIASLAISSTHCLALTEAGEVFSWGKERALNGCLGLGKYIKALKTDGVREEDGWLIAERPTKIELPGKVAAVFCQDNFSAFLM